MLQICRYNRRSENIQQRKKKSYTNNQAHDNAHGGNVPSTSWKIMYTGIVQRVKINGEYKNGTRASEPNKLIEIEDSKEEEKKK